MKSKKSYIIYTITNTLFGGDRGIRTPDLLHAKQALSQLSYAPIEFKYVKEYFMFIDKINYTTSEQIFQEFFYLFYKT